jgi:hypothetical protein
VAATRTVGPRAARLRAPRGLGGRVPTVLLPMEVRPRYGSRGWSVRPNFP